MKNKLITTTLASLLFLSSVSCVWASASPTTTAHQCTAAKNTEDATDPNQALLNSFDCLPPDPRPAYIGVILGYGNTNWNQMISQDSASANSTPISADGSGAAMGIFAGYEVTSHFAVEANYMRFPNAKVQFQSGNVYGIDSFNSTTNEYSVLAKFMVPVGSPKFKAFSEVGPAYVQRDDVMAQKGRIGAVFGLGLDYNFAPHWMTEMGFQYYTGYGVSELKPVYDYIPFLYTVNLRLAYRFSLG